MMRIFLLPYFLFFIVLGYGQPDDPNRVSSVVDSTNAQEIVLSQSFTIHAPIDEVWEAFTTSNGWEMWAVPLAEVNLEIGGKIRTNYNPNGSLSDSTAISLTVVNYVPKKLLTLQADLSKNWPAFMKKDQKRLFNIITFDELSDNQVDVVSYGIGYTTDPDYIEVLKFFIPANAGLYNKLIDLLEN